MKISFVEHLVANDAADAKRALNALLGKSASTGRSLGFDGKLDGLPSISRGDIGFNGLANLYSRLIRNQSPPGIKMDKIVRIIDACATVPDKRGSANLIVVEWAHGQHTDTSYEEIRELISKSFDGSIWPLQLLLFIGGISVQVATIMVTHFPRKKQKEVRDVVNTKPHSNNGSTTKTDHGEPTKE